MKPVKRTETAGQRARRLGCTALAGFAALTGAATIPKPLPGPVREGVKQAVEAALTGWRPEASPQEIERLTEATRVTGPSLLRRFEAVR